MKFSYKRMEEVFLLLAANKDIPVPVNSFGRKALSSRKIMTVLEEEAPANYVPAAAVIQIGRAHV